MATQPTGEDTAVATLTVPARPIAITAGNIAAITTAAVVAAPLTAAAVVAAPIATAGAYAYHRWRTGRETEKTEKVTVTKTTGTSGSSGTGGTFGRSARGAPSSSSAGHRAGTSTGRPGGPGTGGGRTAAAGRSTTGQASSGQKSGRWPWTTGRGRAGNGHGASGQAGTGRTGRRWSGRSTTTGRTGGPRTPGQPGGQPGGQAGGRWARRPGRVAGAVEAVLAGQRQRTARDAAGAALAHARTIHARHPLAAAGLAAAIRATRNAHRRARHRVLAAQGLRPDGTPVPPAHQPAPTGAGKPAGDTDVRPTVDRPAHGPEREPAMARPPLPAGGNSALLDLTRRYVTQAAALADQAATGKVGMLRVRDEFWDMATITALLTDMLAYRADVARKHLPVDPAVPDLLRRIAAAIGGAAVPAKQLGETLDATDYDAYARLLRPRAGEGMLDVAVNPRRP